MNPDYLNFEVEIDHKDRTEPTTLRAKLNAGHFFPRMANPIAPIPSPLLAKSLANFTDEELENAKTELLNYRAEVATYEASKNAIQSRYDADWAEIRELLRKENGTGDLANEEMIFQTAARIAHALKPTNEILENIRSIELVYREIAALK
jgi:hypothetical protein